MKEKQNRDFINYAFGIFFGVIACYMWNYDKFLYFTCFSPIVVMWYIIINLKLKKVKE